MTIKHVSRRLRRFARANKAVSALEYAILVGVVALAAAGAIQAFSGQINTTLKNIGDKIATEVPGSFGGDDDDDDG